MRKILRFFLLILVFNVIIAVSIYAGDTSGYEFYGFSDDLNYCAFERYGVQDGSGFSYSEIFVVDVVQNDYVVKPITIVDQSEKSWLGRTRFENQKKALGLLEKYQIDYLNKGTYIHIDSRGGVQHSFPYGSEVYTLRLIEYVADVPETEIVEEKGFELQLVKNKKIQILQKDKSVPKSRHYTYKYRLAAAWCNQDRIAVLIELEKTGFEGADKRQIIVTGVINN